MDLTHLHGFIDGMMKRKSLDAMLPHMADDMVLRTPLTADRFVGKAAIGPVVTALMAAVDRFEFREILHGPDHVAVSFGVRVGSADLDGIDHIRLNAAGLVQDMRVYWRPLPAVVTALNEINRGTGQPAVALTPAP